VIFGGLALAAGFTLFLTPVVYALIAPWSRPRARQAEQLAEELAAAGESA
jgi:hydrophobic/amphiphilic exporter-1 (mainly G- bacteria), HAE1 family